MEGKNDLNEDLAIPQRKNTVTYDELRRKNRDEYAKTHYGPQRYVWNIRTHCEIKVSSANWKIFSNIHFDSQNQPGEAAAGQPQSASSGSYNTNPGPTPGPFINQSPSDDRRANFRSRVDDDSKGGQKVGPKNRYGMDELQFWGSNYLFELKKCFKFYRWCLVGIDVGPQTKHKQKSIWKVCTQMPHVDF